MKYTFMLLAAIYFLSSCEKESSPPDNTSKYYGSIRNFFKQEGVKLQRFSANSSIVISLTTAKGNKILFQPNSFVTKDNIPVTGTVNLEVKEITELAEIILSNMPTISDEGILNSGGEFFVRVTQNGNELKLAQNAIMKIEIINTKPGVSAMQVFNGTLLPDSSITWIRSKNPINSLKRDTATFRAAISVAELNWVNADILIGGEKISYSINKGNSPAPDETQIFIHYTGLKSVIPFNDFYSKSFIAGSITVIGLCIKDNQLYYSFIPANMQDGGSTTLYFIKATEIELKQKLQMLK